MPDLLDVYCNCCGERIEGDPTIIFFDDESVGEMNIIVCMDCADNIDYDEEETIEPYEVSMN